jgi:ABC-2 type transport system permease protein
MEEPVMVRSNIIGDILTVSWRELKHFLREKSRIFMTLLQPFIWLCFMGNVMNNMLSSFNSTHMLGGASNYLAYATPGIIIMNTFFVGIFGGSSILWDKRFGFLSRLLSTPVHRSAIPLAKIFVTVIQSFIQVSLIVIVAGLFGVTYKSGFLGVLLMLVFTGFFCSILISFSIAIASKVQSHEVFFGMINIVIMPLIFMSTALFPQQGMPSWMRGIATFNPISYAVKPLRSLVIEKWNWSVVLPNGGILIGIAIVCIIFGVIAFRKNTRE